MSTHAIERAPDERVNWIASIPMFLIHGLCLLALVTGVTWQSLVLCAVLYFGRMWFITAGYHRYFSHRSYKTNRAFQFVLAFGGGMAAQKGALWWAGHHRDHHRFSDTERDRHSPQKGFWWSHVGLDPLRQVQGVGPRRHQGLQQVPGDPVPDQARLDPAVDPRHRQLPDRRVARRGGRLLLVHRAAVARHLHRELPRPRHGPAPLRHHRHQPELRLIALWTVRRGLAQQPPLLPGVGPQRLLLVGVRPRPTTGSRASVLVRHGQRPQDPARAGLAAARVRDGRSTWACSRPTGPRPPPPSRPTPARPTLPSPRSMPPWRPWSPPGPWSAPVPRCPRSDAESATPTSPSRDAIEEKMHASRLALEESVRNAMHSAEELASLSSAPRHRPRRLTVRRPGPSPARPLHPANSGRRAPHAALSVQGRGR